MMPFTTSESRHITDTIGPATVGDRCFLRYREMLRAWRASMRWTTAHELYRKMKKDILGLENTINGPTEQTQDDIAAYELAWDVFFALHVMPYELLQRTKNGEVDY
jgi:hypothetical protein